MSLAVQLEQDLSVHGVAVRFGSAVADHFARLTLDYEPFFVPAATREPVSSDADPLTFAVDFEDPGEKRPTDKLIAGSLGDTVVLAEDGSVRVFGPAIDDQRAYKEEIRAYLTATVLRRLVTTRGAQQFHASAVEGGRGAVLFAGAKKMGKTSMALLSTLGGASYMSNDITLLSLADQVAVLGLPQPLTVGLGAVNWFATRRPESGLDRSRIDGGLTDHQLYNLEIDDKQELTRSAIVRLGCGVKDGPAPLSSIVFPEPNLSLDRPRIRLLARDEAMTRLAMLAEAFLKWEWPVALGADAYFDRMREVVSAAVEQADCYHFQWCPDHDRNLDLLRGTVL
ncbi:hypothetical protein [Streptomyces sp. Agncl-13]|uniref:hypothetical protein n=1 Tax=Streptomyces sp. Agncl-13 TaxID=3400628 RepID=UPI003A894F10